MSLSDSSSGRYLKETSSETKSMGSSIRRVFEDVEVNLHVEGGYSSVSSVDALMRSVPLKHLGVPLSNGVLLDVVDFRLRLLNDVLEVRFGVGLVG